MSPLSAFPDTAAGIAAAVAQGALTAAAITTAHLAAVSRGGDLNAFTLVDAAGALEGPLLAVVDVLDEAGQAQHVLRHALAPLAARLRAREGGPFFFFCFLELRDLHRGGL